MKREADCSRLEGAQDKIGGHRDARKKPNLCIIWGDDIGQSNVSAYPLKRRATDFDVWPTHEAPSNGNLA